MIYYKMGNIPVHEKYSFGFILNNRTVAWLPGMSFMHEYLKNLFFKLSLICVIVDWYIQKAQGGYY